MTTQELEQLIEVQTETQNLDFKADMPWNPQDMAKDFIAMANVRDGGTIVIGVNEVGDSFIGTGVSAANIKTYSTDIMRDKLARYMDPLPDFRVFTPLDLRDRKYVVIKISPFKDVPVISRTDIQGKLKGQTIYYRNTNKRVESAPVANSNDLRDIIEAAAVKMMQIRRSAGFILAEFEPVKTEKTEHTRTKDRSESITVPDDGILAIIKQRGYWEINLTPLVLPPPRPLKQGLGIVERSRTRLNWDFPHVPHNNNDQEWLRPGSNYYQAESNLGARKEVWQIYQSERFIMYRSLVEDWYADDSFLSSIALEYPVGKFLTLYTSLTLLITEVIEFISRLGQNGFYEHGVKIELTLNRMKNRQLKLDATGRTPFMYDRVTLADTIAVGGEYTVDDLIGDGINIGNRFILEILSRFDYHPSPDTIKSVQQDWLRGIFQR
ncbi:ATP-binding protein [Mucilaginibacter robiniae]|uniref:ATP-binding protein n=1 Tax=Mucilaginibacter robiniae TaxID=2728022 RepID=A0A7L5DYG5_9SPHI|nr:ATP-binding protein [Mucilaginibacter robiniae]QJD96140.1 ATP-binding protein [Mucilaginibacter robiniae]